MALEIVDRQAQQPAEDAQRELGVEPRPDHGDDQAPGVGQHGLVERDDDDQRAQQNQGRDAAELEHPVHHRHDDQRREHGQHADGERGDGDVAQRLALPQHDAGEPGQAERRILGRLPAVGAQQDRLARPGVGEQQLVDGDRLLGGWPARIPELDQVALRVGRHHQRGVAVAQQQHHRSAVAHAHQLTPAQPNGARPQAGVLRPFRKHRRRGWRIAGAVPQLSGVELASVEPRRADQGRDPRMGLGLEAQRSAFVGNGMFRPRL